MKQSNKFSFHHFQNGIALIELIFATILISLLILGVIAIIDPFERSKERSDEVKMETAIELGSYIDKYIVEKNGFPWETGSEKCRSYARNGDISALNTTQIADCLIDIDSNLKPSEEVAKKIISYSFYVSEPVKTYNSSSLSAHNFAICFKPESRLFKMKGEARYLKDSLVDKKNCPSVDPDSEIECYVCILR